MDVESTLSTEEIRLDKKVTVKSIAPWTTGAARKTSAGDITIPAMGSVLLSREEIIAQGQNSNTLLIGIDGIGSHATWYVEDEYTRKELSFETDDKKQEFLTKEMVKKLFEIKNIKEFKKNIEEKVMTRAEKGALLSFIKALKLNDYERISFCVEYTGMKM